MTLCLSFSSGIITDSALSLSEAGVPVQRFLLELVDDFFRNAELRVPAKQPVTLRIDEDVLVWFKAQGKGYQTRINKLLRQYMKSQTAKR
ncbi:BrnA antitoxin of type II toxin-antitoxin system [Marinobacter sp. LV10MA510-1]|nr:BrnA antitoxin of type II toxin-antitoxin system [Marinobacter sp. LV10MA510-1]PFG53526.1 BrnA antitoxin of type II toxin-antitoxin system [Marinobacter sp. LV10R520-4]